MKRNILPAEYNIMSDHDLLIQVAKDVEWLKIGFSNHLAHLQKLNYIIAAAACSGIGSLVTGLILLFIKTRGA